MPVKTIAMKRLEGKKRTFYMDEHGPYRHVDVDFYPAELVEKIITDLSNQVLEERKKWTSMFDHFKAKRKELRDARHAVVREKDKLSRCLNLLVSHDLIKDCPYKVAVKNLVKGEGERNVEIAQPQAMPKERNKQVGSMREETANKAEWKPFDALPKLDCPFHIKYAPNAAPIPAALRIHREPRSLPHLQCQDGSEWKDVDMVNTSWIVRNCEWRYVEESVKEKA